MLFTSKNIRNIAAIALLVIWITPAINFGSSFFWNEPSVEFVIKQTEKPDTSINTDKAEVHIRQIRKKVITFTGIIGLIHQYYN